MAFKEWYRENMISGGVDECKVAEAAWRDGSKELKQALRDTAALLEKVGSDHGHGATYTARELHPDLFARIDRALANS